MKALTEAECKGSIRLGTGCRKCSKCFNEALYMADTLVSRDKEEFSPQLTHMYAMMESVGKLVALAMKEAKHDAFGATTILKIATAAVETINTSNLQQAAFENALKQSKQ